MTDPEGISYDPRKQLKKQKIPATIPSVQHLSQEVAPQTPSSPENVPRKSKKEAIAM